MNPDSFSWREGRNEIMHAIKNCDPNASAWVAECGELVTGPEIDPENYQVRAYCQECLHDKAA